MKKHCTYCGKELNESPLTISLDDEFSWNYFCDVVCYNRQVDVLELRELKRLYG